MSNSSKQNVRGRRSDAGRPVEPVAAVAALALAAIVIGGGLWLFSHRKAGPRVELLVAADTTGSVHTKDRQKLFGVLDETVSGFLPRGTPVEMWSFDVNAHKFSEVTPNRPEDLWADEDEIIGVKTAAFGTHPAVVLNEMTSSVKMAQQQGRGSAIMLLTDGEDQDPKSTEAAMSQLAGMTALKAVWFCGTTAENGFRSQLERRMEPMLGDRLVVSGANDAESGLNRFKTLIER